MARTTSGDVATYVDLGLEDDQQYVGVLVSAKVVKSKIEGWQPQLEVDWELRQGAKLRDWLGLGLTLPNKQPTKMRELLNAIAEKPKGEDLWWDADTLEWGYDVDGVDTTPAYAKLTPGMTVSFVGENRKDKAGVKRYKVTGYRSPGNGKVKPR